MEVSVGNRDRDERDRRGVKGKGKGYEKIYERRSEIEENV